MRMHPICIFRYNDLLKRTAALKEWCSAKEGEFTAKLGEVDGCELIKLEAMQTNLKVRLRLGLRLSSR